MQKNKSAKLRGKRKKASLQTQYGAVENQDVLPLSLLAEENREPMVELPQQPQINNLTVPVLKRRYFKPVFIVTAAVVVVAAGFLGFKKISFNNFKHSSEVKGQSVMAGNEASQQRQEAVDLVLNVSKIILLPDGEQPNIATVSDLALLADQPFFEKARVGDKALIYFKAGKAFLYRPSENKIIEVGSFDPNSVSMPGSGSAKNKPVPTPAKTKNP